MTLLPSGMIANATRAPDAHATCWPLSSPLRRIGAFGGAGRMLIVVVSGKFCYTNRRGGLAGGSRPGLSPRRRRLG